MHINHNTTRRIIRVIRLFFLASLGALNACGTLINSGGDKQIVVVSENINTKFFHNGKFIGKGHSAVTYASGAGTDVLSSTQPGCQIATTNVKKGVSVSAIMMNLGYAILDSLIAGLIFESTQNQNPFALRTKFNYGASATLTFSLYMGIDAASGALRQVDYTRYDLTPACPNKGN